MSALSLYEVLDRKRRGEAISPGEIHAIIRGFTDGEIPDYQMTAFLMALAIRGMSGEETVALTQAMLESGEQWNLHERHDFIADKHSTGGVGDKISIVLAPLVAACGIPIGMLSGRGLGHTGGTLDKLESIPGFNAHLNREEFERCIEQAGCAIATSTVNIAPADRRMYALRDVTGTVESIPLITASIMSKKLAMGASALLLDVKTGRGAFMKTIEESRELAHSLIQAAAGSPTRVEVIISDMERPLGIAVGNANEIRECFDVLGGGGPEDVRHLAIEQTVRLLVLSNRFDESSARTAADDAIDSGRAMEQTRRWLETQGADPEIADHPERLPSPSSVVEIRAPRSGYISSIDTQAGGMLAVDLGAGRRRPEDPVDPAAGIQFDRNRGDQIRAGERIATILLGRRTISDEELQTRFLQLVRVEDAPPPVRPLIHERIQSER